MRIRALGPLGVVLALAFPGAALAAVEHCVGTSGGTCAHTDADTGIAVGHATDGDTIRFGAGTFGPVDTNKVLTFQGTGAGTLASTTGATIIQAGAVGEEGIRLTRGGSVRSLRAVGGPADPPSSVAGTGLTFSPFEPGDMSFTAVDVIAAGGTGSGAYGGTGVALGDSQTTGVKTATFSGGAILSGIDSASFGQGLYTCCIQANLINTTVSGRSGVGMYSSLYGTTTVEGSSVEGVTAIRTQAPDSLMVRRSRVEGSYEGISTVTDSVQDTNISIRDSLFTTTSSSGGVAPVTIEASSGGQPINFEAVGSTFIGRGTSQAAVRAWRANSGSAPLNVTLRNSVARNEAAGGVDLLADRATIGADFSSFNTTSTPNIGSAPAPGSAGNVAGDPQLAADFSLLASSPLIDRGDGGAVLAGELDLAGAARSLDGNGDCAPVPDIGAFERPSACPPVVAVANAAPSLENVSATNRVFAPTGPNGRITQRRRVKRGTRFRYRLSEPARVEIRIERALAGRRSGRRCVRPTRRNRRARRCTRYRRVTTLRANERAGRQSTGFTGRVRRRPLRRGRYRARLVAIDSLGARSRERRLALRIVKP